MSLFQILLASISFLLGIISILSLFSPMTPSGKFIYKYLVFKNENVTSFFVIYRKLSRYVWGAIFILVVYLLFSLTDFYRLYASMFVVAYYVVLTLILLMIIDSNTVKTHMNKLVLFFGYFVVPIFLLFLNIYMFSYSNTIKLLFVDSTTYLSEKVLHGEEIIKAEELLNLTTSKTLEGYINNYRNYALYSSYMNRILFLHAESREKPLFEEVNTSKTPMALLTNKLQIHVQKSFPPFYKKVLIERSKKTYVEYRKSLKYQHSLFPVKIMPAYLASAIISKISKPFSRVAITTKVIGLSLFKVTSENYVILVSLFLLTNGLLLFYLLAVIFKKYNHKYDKEWGGDYFYSSMVVALLSFAIGVNALII